jgi:hypothetical protein
MTGGREEKVAGRWIVGVVDEAMIIMIIMIIRSQCDYDKGELG